MVDHATTESDLLSATDMKKLQLYVQRTGIERGFSSETSQDSFMLLVEELGEVAKAMRPLHGVKVADDSTLSELSDELADVQLLLLSLANKLGIDIWDAVVQKEKRNRTRTWK
jgi:NTP pyrophosphatase (non-canonical NTP hydrolase)